MIRVACYVDGFNFYHAIDDISRASRGVQNYLKWVNLRSLMEIFTDKAVHQIVAIKYFSAYATWKPGQYTRHLLYVTALEHHGVEVVLGRFKELWALADTRADIKEGHLKACLLPSQIQDGQGAVICTRPMEYDPPA